MITTGGGDWPAEYCQQQQQAAQALTAPAAEDVSSASLPSLISCESDESGGVEHCVEHCVERARGAWRHRQCVEQRVREHEKLCDKLAKVEERLTEEFDYLGTSIEHAERELFKLESAIDTESEKDVLGMAQDEAFWRSGYFDYDEYVADMRGDGSEDGGKKRSEVAGALDCFVWDG